MKDSIEMTICGFWKSLQKCYNLCKFLMMKKRQIIVAVINKFKSNVLLKSDKLEKSVIHEDLSMTNMIIEDNKIIGIIDLSDVIHLFTMFDFTVALSFFILHEFKHDKVNLSDIKTKIKSIFYAYEKQYRKFNDLELSMIHACVCARIFQSLVLGKKSRLRDLSNTYILATQKQGWKALEELLMSIQGDEFIKFLKN